MSLDRDVAGLFCVGFHGTAPSPEVLALVRRGVYGVVLAGWYADSALASVQRILDLQPESLHQRVAVFLGSKEEVERITRYHLQD